MDVGCGYRWWLIRWPMSLRSLRLNIMVFLSLFLHLDFVAFLRVIVRRLVLPVGLAVGSAVRPGALHNRGPGIGGRNPGHLLRLFHHSAFMAQAFFLRNVVVLHLVLFNINFLPGFGVIPLSFFGFLFFSNLGIQMAPDLLTRAAVMSEGVYWMDRCWRRMAGVSFLNALPTKKRSVKWRHEKLCKENKASECLAFYSWLCRELVICTRKSTVPLAHQKFQKNIPSLNLAYSALVPAAADLQSCSVKNLIEISNTEVHRRLHMGI